jgi:hypothetical protein
MMTKTILSAATWASPDAQMVYSEPQRHLGGDLSLACDIIPVQWHRHSCLCAFASPPTLQLADAALSLPSRILIANLELEFKLSSIRINHLKFSNRRFLAIFYPELQPYSAQLPVSTVFFSSIEPLICSFQNLIVTPRLESLATSRKQKPRRISNRNKTPVFFSHATADLALSSRVTFKSR